MNGRVVRYFAVAWAMFAVASASPWLLSHAGLQSSFDAVPWLRHFVVKTVLLALTLAAMSFDGRGWAAFGFRRALPWRRLLLAGGMALGAVASLLVFFTPALGMSQLFKGVGILGLILSVWLYSSITEEVFTRGWYQEVVTEPGVTAARVRRGAIVTSAILFGSMHLSLLWMHIDVWTVLIIVSATTALGFVAAIARHQSSSVFPAIYVHVLFNVGGFIAAAVYTVVTISRTGAPPVP